MAVSEESGFTRIAGTDNISTSTGRDIQTAVFDGHNDVLSKLRDAGGVAQAESFLGLTDFHVDCAKAAQGNFGGGFFAMWVPSPSNDDFKSMMSEPSYDVPLPLRVKQADALPVVLEQAAILLHLQQLGAIEICTTVSALKQCLGSGKLATILHLEGCEAIDPEFHALDVLYAAGLRSIGPVWSRTNIYGEGVPFRYPSTPAIGGGLTQHGFELVKHCNTKGVMIDLAHLNQAGFDDVARHSRHPLVSTHSNAHALCPHARNLTDGQLEQIRASGGIVGLNFAAAFLREDGRMISDVPIVQMLRHLDYLIDKLGEDGVGLGSDFDGAVVPDEIGTVAGLPVLVDAMQKHGYGAQLVQKICHGNWYDVLKKTWGDQ